MKLVHRDLARNGPGSVKVLLLPPLPLPRSLIGNSCLQNFYSQYNFMLWKSWICLLTNCCSLLVSRKVLREVASGGRDAERVKLKLEIVVEVIYYLSICIIASVHYFAPVCMVSCSFLVLSNLIYLSGLVSECVLCFEIKSVDYDKEGSVLRVRGKNITENDHVKIGQFHTLELELKRPFVLRKVCFKYQANLSQDEIWDWLALETIQQACGDDALKKFFEHVLQALLKHIDFEVVQCVVIASPGFTKDQFRDYMFLEAARRDLRVIIENKQRLVLAHATSGYKHSLKEVLDTPGIMALIKDTKAAQEVRALQDFFNMLTNDSARACYGPKHVEIAQDRLAIQTLLITDTLFRNADISTRQKYVNLVEGVKKYGGTVHIFSSMHVSGEQLAQLTGIAAILRFPLPDLEDIEM
ncbi:hypothetical protein HU200_006639 [Digitaria exilis]|uniref:eRF1/Pelota-like N-terminal domain-containing protein n=1 Tax=Digitaria exilis TaxID=1010633 RepID=A0A835KRN4_9POAL|nr:hypothetical protein HU200_006639 [Digitaria exilis]